LKQRAASLAAAVALVLAGCGGGDDGSSCTTSPAAAIRSSPPTVATVGVQYIYVADAIYSCVLGACGAIEPVTLPPGASVILDAVVWTPPAGAANTSAAFGISTRGDLCGNRATQSWSVQVHPRPVIESFGASPERIAPGNSVSLSAVFQGNARVEELPGVAVSSGAPITTPPLNTSTRYTLVVANAIGFETRQSLVVEVQSPPAIQSFTASPAVIGTGASSRLQWSISGHVTQARIQPLGTDVRFSSDLVVRPSETTTYTLQLSNDVGATASTSVEVRVVPPGTIDSFSATPGSTGIAGSATLSARFTGTGTVERDDGNGTYTVLGPIVSDGTLDTGPLYRSTQFRLVARNEVGVAVTSELVVELTGPGTFQLGPQPSVARRRHTATRLQDGRVFIAGGITTATTEIYDPAMQGFSAGPALLATRSSHAAALLADGRVLLFGGFVDGVSQIRPEIYDPATNTVSALGSPAGRAFDVPCAVLNDGRAICGATTSTTGSNIPTGIYIFNPAAGSFSPFIRYVNNLGLVGQMQRLDDGRVLALQPSGASELFAPGSDTFTITGQGLSRGIEAATAKLADGRVLVVGGQSIAAAEVYDPATGEFAMVGQQTFFAGRSRAVTLQSGAVLVVGGNPRVTNAELFDPGTMAFTRTGGMRRARSEHTATLLGDGRVLVVGGCSGLPCEAEIYTR
jgi:hypothetical protein